MFARISALRVYLGGLWSRQVVARLVWIVGFLRTNRQTVLHWPEAASPAGIALGPKVVLFVHFDFNGGLRDYVMTYLRSLQAAGLDVVFVTNSGKLRPEAMERLKGVCAGILIRRNIGYDFGAWQDGLSQLALPRPGTQMILLANDSVYGPLRPLTAVLDQVDFAQADMWGLTESWQTRFHLQSYFIAAGRAAIQSQAWRDFWSSVRPVPSKHYIVKTFEVGLTQSMLRAGLRCKAIWPYATLANDLDESLFVRTGRNEPELIDPAIAFRRFHAQHIRNSSMQRTPLNPTSDLWRQLLDAKYPFIKRELLRSNPSQVQDVADWYTKLTRMQIDATEIAQDLQRALRNRSP